MNELAEAELPADSAGALVLDEARDEVGGLLLVRLLGGARHGDRVHEIPEECRFRHHDFHAHIVDDDFGLARGQKHLREGARHPWVGRRPLSAAFLFGPVCSVLHSSLLC